MEKPHPATLLAVSYQLSVKAMESLEPKRYDPSDYRAQD